MLPTKWQKMTELEAKNKRWEKIFSVIQQSYAIDKHVEFFNWLQTSVHDLVPHNMLLASWGNFDESLEKPFPSHLDSASVVKLNYDISSSVEEMSTQIILNAPHEVDFLMAYLHDAWLINNRRWFVINNLTELEANHPYTLSPLSDFQQFKSMLVYGISDVRGSNECLYIFFSKQSIFEVQDSVMGLIMPHIDHALRKIQHLTPVNVSDEPVVDIDNAGNHSNLSAREFEIIHWVKSGKTNQEIGMILEISQNTVKSHLKRIFGKLNVTRRAQAVAILSDIQYGRALH